MDLQDFEGQSMYFDEQTPEEVDALIQQASELYGEGNAEEPLLKAKELAPDNMLVLVALYRFYYYQHRLEEALDVAGQVMAVIAPSIDFPANWRDLTFRHLANGVLESFTKVRFYLLALKGAAYLNLRLGRRAEAVEMLNMVVEYDSHDRLGARSLLRVVGPVLVTENV